MNTVSLKYYNYSLKLIEAFIEKKNLCAQKLRDSRSPPFDKNGRVEYKYFFQLFNAANDILKDPLLGLHLGQLYRAEGYEAVASHLAYSKDMAEAVSYICRYAVLDHTLSTPIIKRASNAADKLVWAPNFNMHSYPIVPIITEYSLTTYALILDYLAWSHGKGVKQVLFTHSAPEDSSQYNIALDCDVKFGCKENAIVLHDGIFDARLPTANAIKLMEAKAYLDHDLAIFNGQDALHLHVAYKIHELIKTEKPTFPKIASELTMSERTLRRQLHALNINFGDILASVRKERSTQLMSQGRSAAHIADSLWYSDQAAFSRAFKTWHGVSPKHYKREDELA